MIDGRTRTITIIDEEIKEADIYDVGTADIHAARQRAMELAKAAGPHSVAANALEALSALAEFAADRERKDIKKRSLEPIDNDGILFNPDYPDHPLAWFFMPEAQQYVRGVADANMAKVFGFGKTLAVGDVFVARASIGRSVETRYVGYERTFRPAPGTVLLDATADIGGVTQLCPWRKLRDVPQARYDRLTIIAEKPYPVKRLDLLFGKAKGLRDYTQWMVDKIKKHTQPGERVLIVCKLDLFDQEYVTAPIWDIGDGYQVHATHWGNGIGSNKWKDCTTVFLFGDFHIPRRIHIGNTQALLDYHATDPEAPTMTMGAINSRNPHVDAIEAGHLLRYEKQMLLRPNGRNFDQHGVCGEQKVVYCGDIKRLLANVERMYPGAKLVNAGGVGAGKSGRGGKQTNSNRVLAFLAETTKDIIKPIDLPLDKPWNTVRRDIVTPAFRTSLAALGWSYGGKGRAVAFRRISTVTDALPIFRIVDPIPGRPRSAPRCTILHPLRNVSPLRLKDTSVWDDGGKSSGRLLDITYTDKVTELERRVSDLNDFIDGFDTPFHSSYISQFECGDHPLFDWNLGGRLYSVGEDNYQQLGGAERARIRINGKPTCELDIRASNLTIFQALVGQPLDFVNNPGLDPYTLPGLPREVVKAFITAIR